MVSYRKYYSKKVQEEGFKEKIKAGVLGLGMLASAAAGTKINPNTLFSQISKHEGVRPTVYKDTMNHPTVGIGFNLDDRNNRAKLQDLGIDVNELLQGKPLTDREIKTLYNISLTTAYNDAKKFLPNFSAHPEQVQRAIVDMSFNMGLNKLMQFQRLRNALMMKDYNLAANEMMNSRWAKQVGRRAVNLANLVKSASS